MTAVSMEVNITLTLINDSCDRITLTLMTAVTMKVN